MARRCSAAARRVRSLSSFHIRIPSNGTQDGRPGGVLRMNNTQQSQTRPRRSGLASACQHRKTSPPSRSRAVQGTARGGFTGGFASGTPKAQANKPRTAVCREHRAFCTGSRWRVVLYFRGCPTATELPSRAYARMRGGYEACGNGQRRRPNVRHGRPLRCLPVAWHHNFLAPRCRLAPVCSVDIGARLHPAPAPRRTCASVPRARARQEHPTNPMAHRARRPPRGGAHTMDRRPEDASRAQLPLYIALRAIVTLVAGEVDGR